MTAFCWWRADIPQGADNQRSDAVLNLLFGDAMRGLDQLRR